MRKIMVGALTAAVALAGGLFGSQAAAMTAAMPSLHAAAKAKTLPIERVRNICGSGGCAPVLVKRYQRPTRKFTATVTPLVVAGAPAPAPAPTKPWPLSLLQGK